MPVSTTNVALGSSEPFKTGGFWLLWLRTDVCAMAALRLVGEVGKPQLAKYCEHWGRFAGRCRVIMAIHTDRSLIWYVIGLHPWYHTVYPKKYAYGFVVLCFVVVMQSFIMYSHELFIHIHQGCFAGTGAIVRCHSASEVSLMDMGKSVNVWPQQSTAKQKPCAYFLGYTV